MSIATIAPEKFDFQDLVAIEIALHFIDAPGSRLLVEPPQGEDAELHFDGSSGDRIVVEIQVKGSGGAVSIDSVATCLAHFPPRQASGCLFERLAASPKRVALLVMSGRCDDSASVYLGQIDSIGAGHKDGHFSSTQADGFLTAFSKVELKGDKASTLKAERKGHCRTLSRSAKAEDVRDLLRRVVVMENVTAAEIKSRCAIHLEQKYGVPGDRTTYAISEMHTAIKQSKADQVDALPLLRRTLAKHRPLPLRPAGYVERGVEGQWLRALSGDNALLFSGTPRCGKTDAALCVADEFQKLGYEVREGESVEDAARFLMDPGGGKRLFCLDDPLGGTHPKADAMDSPTRLRNLIGRLSPTRKLVVAQNQDLLFETTREQSLIACAVAGRNWHDLSAAPQDFLVCAWETMANDHAIPRAVREGISNFLANGSERLELGCLRHLASTYDLLPPNASIDDMLRQARQDASSLSRALVNDERMEELLSVLAVGSVAAESISVKEIAFIGGAGGTTVPGRRSDAGTMIEVIGPDPLPDLESTPEYEQEPILEKESLRCVEQLERRRFINAISNGLVSFAIPFYRAAAEAVLSNPTDRVAGATTTMVERGLLCLSAGTSRATARNLEWLLKNLATRPEHQERLFGHVINGMRSIFWATRDLCFTFLVRHFDQLPKEQQAKSTDWVHYVTRTSLDEIRWRDGQACVDLRLVVSGMEIMERHLQKVDRKEVQAEINALERSDSAAPLPEQAALVLKYFRDHPEDMSATILGRYLSYDEAALRAYAVTVWLSIPRKGDADLLARIFDETHPSIALAAYEGAASGWNSYDDERRDEILSALEKQVSNALSAIVVIDKLVQFDRTDEDKRDLPWKMLGRLLPIALRSLPAGAFIHEARLYHVTQLAVRHLDATTLLPLFDAWASWLERELRRGILPDECMLGLADLLVDGTTSRPDLRWPLILRLLKLPGTGAILVVLKDLINSWDLLVPAERQLVEDAVVVDRPDRKWLQAVAITRKTVPPEIQNAIFRNADFLGRTPAEIIDALPATLLEAAMAVFCGTPQPLWWIGTHHSGRPQWDGVIDELCLRTEHPLFRPAFEEAISRRPASLIARIIRAAREDALEGIFEVMLRRKLFTNGEWKPEAWRALFERAPSKEVRSRWLDRMAEIAFEVLDDLFEIEMWLSDPGDQNDLRERLRSDEIVTLLVANLVKEDFEDRNIYFQIVQLIEKVFDDVPPDLYKTCDFVLRGFERKKIVAETCVAKVQRRRGEIFEKKSAIGAERAKAERELSEWIKS